ncbi:LysM peptidoglycan-binding domain-containing protein [Vibrio maritimus]|uniref:LysM peptidoglycan-binding domain-containing protein n=1 Tax=Vibrio maritimus TaxID=990268 RepID=UPI004067D7C7
MKQGNVLLLRGYIVVVTLVLGFPTLADNSLTLKDQAPSLYQVKKGDTLWAISSLYLHSPWRWPELWGKNRHIHNPHLIYPGDRLSLNWVDGEPRLTRKKLEKLSPRIQIASKAPIAAINAITQARYTRREGLVLSSELRDFPKVIGSSTGLKYVTAQDDVYINYQGNETDWAIYRVSQTFSALQPEYSMQQVRMVAVAKTKSKSADITTLEIERPNHEVKQQDVVIPLSSIQTPEHLQSFEPHAGIPVDGLAIVGMMEATHYAVRGQAVVLNHGFVSGIEQGSSYTLMRPAQAFQFAQGEHGLTDTYQEGLSQQLPTIEIGHLVVIRSYPFFSIALITEASEPITRQTIVTNPDKTPTS